LLLLLFVKPVRREDSASREKIPTQDGLDRLDGPNSVPRLSSLVRIHHRLDRDRFRLEATLDLADDLA